MVRRLLRTLTIALAIFGLASIVLPFLRASIGEPTPDGLTYVLSPSGSHKAALATWAGGGGISPYCQKRLTIVKAEATAEEAISKAKSVFEAECESFSPSSGIVRSSPQIKWESDQSLKVTFSIFGTVLNPIAVKLRKQDASGYIVVNYEVQR